jgi:nicotinamide-nucleotide amidase
VADAAASILAILAARGAGLAVAESLTGGLLTDAFVRVPGASAVLRGGIVAYDTAVKASLLGVDPELLAAHGAVHPDVAAQMAAGVRVALAVAGEPAYVGVATTGVAGPDAQDGQPVGTVYLGFAIGDRVEVERLDVRGDRAAIRAAAVSESLGALERRLRE